MAAIEHNTSFGKPWNLARERAQSNGTGLVGRDAAEASAFLLQIMGESAEKRSIMMNDCIESIIYSSFGYTDH